MNDTPRIQIIQNSCAPVIVANGAGVFNVHVFNATGATQAAELLFKCRNEPIGPFAAREFYSGNERREIKHGDTAHFMREMGPDSVHVELCLSCANISLVAVAMWEPAKKEPKSADERIESASAIITELLARTAKCDCRESDDAVAAAMAWLNDNTP